ncbi:MAG: hypothetical protein KKI16_03590 [Alphaproteobacteria bacterium]|nr:hypothetical protein [Alphaproteobacteria bacterium]
MMRPFAVLCLLAPPALADTAQIMGMEATSTGAAWQIDVTLAHPDTGWDHYADGWRIEDSAGTVLATRTLMHPHVNEQPFTRGLTVAEPLPTRIFVRVSCNVDGWAESAAPFDLQP